MIKLFIDCREIECAKCDSPLFTLDVEKMTSAEYTPQEKFFLFRAPATNANRQIMNHTDQILSVDRFNDTLHYGQIEAMSAVILPRGKVFLEKFISQNAECGEYLLKFIPECDAWKRAAAESLMKDLAIQFESTLSDAVIRDSWSQNSPFVFLPVQRDRFNFQFDITSSTPISILTVENYHPFLHLSTALRNIVSQSGYTIDSQFLSSGFFESLYISGNYPSTNCELLKSRMAFNAGRLSDSDSVQVAAGEWVFANPDRAIGANIGNIVESASSHDDITFYNNGGCFRMLDGKIVFIPTEAAVIGFEYELRYECGFSGKSMEELNTFNNVTLEDGLTYSFKVPNTIPTLNNSTHFRDRMVLHCNLTDEYYARLHLVFESGAHEYINLIGDTTYLMKVEYVASAQVEISTDGTNYIPTSTGWALYSSELYYGTVQVSVKLRSQPKYRAAGEIIRFDGISFSGYDMDSEFKLLSTTRLRPIFGQSPGVGSEISTQTLMAHDGIYQLTLFEAVAHMFNLRFYTDPILRKIIIEPYDKFYTTGSIVDWRDKQDSDSEITICECGATLNQRMTYIYRDGDGAVARWNEDKKRKFSRWQTQITNKLANSSEKTLWNPLFTPTRGNASFLPSAQSAYVMHVGDRLRYGVPNDGDMFVAPKIVRYLGMTDLLNGERWGWPAGITSYPFAAFHYPGLGANIPEDFNSVECSDADTLINNGFTLCYDDCDHVKGLHQFYDNMYDQINSGRILRVRIRLTPTDYEMLSTPNSVVDVRSMFILNVYGEIIKCRLLKILNFNPESSQSTECEFMTISNSF